MSGVNAPGPIAVVLNPHAGANRRAASRRAALERVVAGQGFVRAPATLAELESVAAEIRDAGAAVLAVCGGDGSYFRTWSALDRVYGDQPLPAFLPLRGGSMNTIARNVGHTRGRPESVLEALCRSRRGGRAPANRPLQLLRVGEHQLGCLVGTGILVRFLQAYYAASGRGLLAAARVTARVVASCLVGGTLARGLFEEVEGEATCDGVVLPFERYNAVFAASVPDLGLGFRIAYRAGDEMGRFHLIAGHPRPFELAAKLPRLKLGRPLGLASLYDAAARRVSVEFRQPTHYMVDGDVLDPVRRLDIAVGPVIDIVQPA